MSKVSAFCGFFVLFLSFSFAQVMESHVDFTIGPGTILGGKIQYAQEWLSPASFRNKEMRAIDQLGISKLNPSSNQIVAAKVAFISKKSFDELSHSQMNKASFISLMLDTVALKKKTSDAWRATNKVKAYGIPFNVSFDFRFKELSQSALASAGNYLKNEASGVQSSGRERFMTLDMSNFTKLLYRNYAVIYMKEISPSETLIVSSVVAGIDIDKANLYFPFGAEAPLMGNLKTQIVNMVRILQKAK